MFIPVPPGSEQPPLPPTPPLEPDAGEWPERSPEPEAEPVPMTASGHARERWPALLLLSGLCRLLSFLSLVSAAIMTIVGLVIAAEGHALGLLYSVSAIISGIVACIIWRALAEAILLAIAIERNTRQMRDRLPKRPPH